MNKRLYSTEEFREIIGITHALESPFISQIARYRDLHVGLQFRHHLPHYKALLEKVEKYESEFGFDSCVLKKAISNLENAVEHLNKHSS